MLNFLSVDTEDYYHATNLEPVLPRSKWLSTESRVEQLVQRVLEILSIHNTKATFFVLGFIAKKHPKLVKTIAVAGHEIASHGFNHQLIYQLSQNDFYQDVSEAKTLLEDLVGQKVIGYRAPNFSITDATPWAHEILAKAGYLYDSSVYPIYHPRYSNPDKPLNPYRVVTDHGSLVVFPLAVVAYKIFTKNINLPAAGGAYWRLLPLSYTRWALKTINNRELRPAVCYFHPWELDSGQPYFAKLPLLSKIRHYQGLKSFPDKLERIIAINQFSTLKTYYEQVSDTL
ncbi:MAG: DUF3473 domain-containing protein [Deltaproteobacteria bacterium]|nr:DUF3473 domain-containing protein [Deltaproteobacteria bacterium]